jgi:hypothetical protein
MLNFEIIVCLIDKKDHYVATLYKDIRIELNINRDSIILYEINGHHFIRIPNIDYAISIPKFIVPNNSKFILLKILNVYSKSECLLRDPISIDKNLDVNLRSFVPIKTTNNYNFYVLDFYDSFYLWYSVGGGAKPILINKKINAIFLSELIGFFFGDGNTADGIQSFRLNNCEASTLIYSLRILEKLGIPRNEFKAQIIYSSNKDLDDNIKHKCINYWSNILGFRRNQIVSVNKSTAKSESLEYGSARIFLDNNTFLQFMLYGVLKNILTLINNPRNDIQKEILKAFLRGLAAAEGSVILNNYNSLSKISFSFDSNSDELELYKLLLYNLNVNCGGTKGNELYIYGINNFNLFNEIDLFKFHNSRKNKFLYGYNNHKSIRS